MNDLAERADHPTSPRELRAPAHQGFLTIPTRLIVDLHDTPLAVGLYSLIARQYVIAKAPIPLSAPDVMRYDPSLSRGAILRALARLVAGGWVVATQQPGHKTHYTPAWGRVLGSRRPWQIGAPLMGRPRRLIVLRLDQRLLDICMGKITPHPLRTALVERYFTRPLLELADVGTYALALAGYFAGTASLDRLGLVRNGQARPLPPDQHLLALASQRGLEDGSAATLTERGLRRIGCTPAPLEEETSSATQPLFFVPRSMIGGLIGTMIDPLIGHPAPDLVLVSASGSDESQAAPARNRSHGLEQDKGLQGASPQTPLIVERGGGKGSNDQESTPEKQRAQERGNARRSRQRSSRAPAEKPPALDTETAQALAAINVLPAQVAELADLPVALAQAAIRDGQARPGVRDLAGWVVHLLRNARDHGWTIQPPAPRPDSPEALRAAFARYAAEQESVYKSDQEVWPCRCDEPASLPHDAENDLPELWSRILAELQLQLPRREFNTWLRRCELSAIDDGVAVLIAPDVPAKEAIEDRYVRVLCDLLQVHTDMPVTVQVVLHGARPAGDRTAGEPDVPLANKDQVSTPAHVLLEELSEQPTERKSDVAEGRPAWIIPEQWASLPAMMRAALLRSTLVDGAVCAASPFLSRLLHTRYQQEVNALIAACDWRAS